MSRRRALIAALVVLVLAAGAATVALLTGGDDPQTPAPDPAATAYARTWDATCAALRADALRTTDVVRRRLGGSAPGRAARTRLARGVLAPYLGRTQRRLRRVAAATPPPAWRDYHRTVVPLLRRADARTEVVRLRARAGDATAAAELATAPAIPTPRAPDELLARTPACAGATGA